MDTHNSIFSSLFGSEVSLDNILNTSSYSIPLPLPLPALSTPSSLPFHTNRQSTNDELTDHSHSLTDSLLLPSFIDRHAGQSSSAVPPSFPYPDPLESFLDVSDIQDQVLCQEYQPRYVQEEQGEAHHEQGETQDEVPTSVDLPGYTEDAPMKYIDFPIETEEAPLERPVSCLTPPNFCALMLPVDSGINFNQDASTSGSISYPDSPVLFHFQEEIQVKPVINSVSNEHMENNANGIIDLNIITPEHVAKIVVPTISPDNQFPKPDDETAFVHDMYCKICKKLIENEGCSESMIRCVFCGKDVPVDKQYLHPCIQQGLANPHCMSCGVSMLVTPLISTPYPSDSSSFSYVSSTKPNPKNPSTISSAKKRGRKARCQKCDVVCASAGEKRHHMATVHAKDFECHICKAGLRSAENLRRHMMCHGPNPQYWCKTCGAGFTQARGLRVHQAECGVTNRNCLRAVKKIQRNKNDSAIKKISLDAGKKFKCPECDDRFSVRPSVSRHVRIKHRGERPYECEECGRCFTSKYNKKVHYMKAHQR